MRKFFKRLLVFLGILALLPVSFLFTIPRAQAADPQEQLFFHPRFSSRDTSQVYFEGQRIRIDVSYGQIGLTVLANLQVIAQAMPPDFPVKDNGTGTYSLISPPLSGETMVIGSGIAIPFTAVDSKGNRNTVESTYLVTIKPRPLKDEADFDPPARVSAKAGDKEVTVWWTNVPTAAKILVRYRDSQGFFRQIYVPKNHTGWTISNLENGFTYRFEIAGVSSSGTFGASKEILATPQGLPVKAIKGQETAPEKEIKPAIDEGVSTMAQAPQTLSREEVKPIKEAKEVAKTEEEKPAEAQARNWSRLLVAIAILVIAAAAALGGYYGYEWYLARKEEPPKTPGPRSSSRW